MVEVTGLTQSLPNQQNLQARQSQEERKNREVDKAETGQNEHRAVREVAQESRTNVDQDRTETKVEVRATETNQRDERAERAASQASQAEADDQARRASENDEFQSDVDQAQNEEQAAATEVANKALENKPIAEKEIGGTVNVAT